MRNKMNNNIHFFIFKNLLILLLFYKVQKEKCFSFFKKQKKKISSKKKKMPATTTEGHAHAHFAREEEDDSLSSHRRQISDELFKSFDLDGNGAVSFSELQQVLEASKQRRKDGHEGAPVDAALERQRTKWLMAVKSQIHQAREQVKRRQSAASFSLKSSGSTVGNSAGTIKFMGNVTTGDGDPSLDPDAFAEFIRVFAGKYNDEDFATFVSDIRAAVELAYENTFGSKKKKLIWELFQLMDVNHDALIDMKELQLLLNIETKKDKKSLAKWKAILHQRETDKKRTSMRQPDTSGTSSPESFNNSVNSPTNVQNAKERKMSRFVPNEEGILTIKDEDVTGHDSDEEDDSSPPMTLRDFQDFLSDFYGDDVERLEATCNHVRDIILNANRRYLSEMKVDEIMNDIIEDLLRERPHDVLEGIVRSVNRLRRIGNFPAKVYRSWSIASHPFANNHGGSSSNLAEGK